MPSWLWASLCDCFRRNPAWPIYKSNTDSAWLCLFQACSFGSWLPRDFSYPEVTMREKTHVSPHRGDTQGASAAQPTHLSLPRRARWWPSDESSPNLPPIMTVLSEHCPVEPTQSPGPWDNYMLCKPLSYSVVCYTAINNWNILGREIHSTVTLLSGLTVYGRKSHSFSTISLPYRMYWRFQGVQRQDWLPDLNNEGSHCFHFKSPLYLVTSLCAQMLAD